MFHTQFLLLLLLLRSVKKIRLQCDKYESLECNKFKIEVQNAKVKIEYKLGLQTENLIQVRNEYRLGLQN